MAIMCEDFPLCLQFMEHVAAPFGGGRRAEVTLRRHWLSFESAPKRFVIMIVPPQS